MGVRRYILSLMILLTSFMAGAAERSWEEMERMPGDTTEQRLEAPGDVAVTVSDGYVYVAVNERTTVKMFTILGQLIVQETLSPGIYRYKLTTRGIYLLKIGSITRRVTL